MSTQRISWTWIVLLLAMMAPCVLAQSKVGLQPYTAVVDDVSGDVLVVGQRIVHQGFDARLTEASAPVPILSLQYTGRHYREAPPDNTAHAEARAKSVAERMVHAWTLMDHGARLEVAEDDWKAFGIGGTSKAEQHVAVYVRSPVAGAEPLRILTIYPQDVAAYPWISSERSLADYLANLMWSHYLLFWRHEGDLSKYRTLRLDKTGEGRIFSEVAARAMEAARKKGLSSFDSATVRAVLAELSLSERGRLYRLATTPPMDWESTAE